MGEMIRLAMKGIDQAQSEAALLSTALEAASQREAALEATIEAAAAGHAATEEQLELALAEVAELKAPGVEAEKRRMLEAAGGDVHHYIASLETALHGCEAETRKLRKEFDASQSDTAKSESARRLEATIEVKEEELNVCTSEIIHLRDSLGEMQQLCERERAEGDDARAALDKVATESQTELLNLLDRIDELEQYNISLSGQGASSPVSNKRDVGADTGARLWLHAVSGAAKVSGGTKGKTKQINTEDHYHSIGRDKMLHEMLARLHNTMDAEGKALHALVGKTKAQQAKGDASIHEEGTRNLVKIAPLLDVGDKSVETKNVDVNAAKEVDVPAEVAEEAEPSPGDLNDVTITSDESMTYL